MESETDPSNIPSILKSPLSSQVQADRLLTREAPIALLLTDDEGRILAANKAISRLLLYKPKKLHGMVLHTLAPPSDSHRIEKLLDHAINEHGREYTVDTRLRNAQGLHLPVRLHARPVRKRTSNQQPHIAVAAYDLTRFSQGIEAAERRTRLFEAAVAGTRLETILNQWLDGVESTGTRAQVALFATSDTGKLPDWQIASQRFDTNTLASLARPLREWLAQQHSASSDQTVGRMDSLENYLSNTVEIPTESKLWCFPVKGSDKSLLGVVITVVPVTRGRSAKKAIQDWAQLVGRILRYRLVAQKFNANQMLLSAVVKHASVGIAIYDDTAHFIECNDAFAHMLGYEPDLLIGRSYLDLLTDARDSRDAHANLEALLEGHIERVESRRWLRRNDGSQVLARLSTNLLRDDNDHVRHIVDVVTDITESHELNQELAFRRSHDPLTGLINRHEFRQYLQRAIQTAKNRNETFALMIIDLDRFKGVNDTFGPATGDRILKEIGQAIRDAARPEDIVARLGNDEFGILLNTTQTEDIQDLAERMVTYIEAYRFRDQGETVRVSASIGVAIVDKDNNDITEIMQQADAAHQVARSAGGNQARLFRAGDQVYALQAQDMRWASRIHEALDEGRMVLFRQPIISLLNPETKIYSYEYLIRMLDRNGQVIEPAQFLPAAERYAMMGRIDRWVIETVLNWLSSHPTELQKLNMGTINLSGQSLSDPDLCDFIEKSLEKHGVPPRKICFEVTETVAVSDLNAAKVLIEKLHETGCLFALDDFGSGMSSFGYLKELPVDFLKIDGRFVRNLDQDLVDRGMVRAMHEIARLTDKRTIAEFVEGEETLSHLRDIGVDFAQGYALGMPEPLGKTGE